MAQSDSSPLPISIAPITSNTAAMIAGWFASSQSRSIRSRSRAAAPAASAQKQRHRHARPGDRREDRRQRQHLPDRQLDGADDHAGTGHQREFLEVDHGQERADPQRTARARPLERAHPARHLRLPAARPAEPDRNRADHQQAAERDPRPPGAVGPAGPAREPAREQRDDEGERGERHHPPGQQAEAAVRARRREQEHHDRDHRQRAQRNRDRVGQEVAEDLKHAATETATKERRA